MIYRVEWSKAAVRQVLNIPKRQRVLIVAWIKENLDGCVNPRNVANGKQLQGTGSGWRWRVGSYRLLAKIEDEKLVIVVVRVGHRQGAYKNLPKM